MFPDGFALAKISTEPEFDLAYGTAIWLFSNAEMDAAEKRTSGHIDSVAPDAVILARYG